MKILTIGENACFIEIALLKELKSPQLIMRFILMPSMTNGKRLSCKKKKRRKNIKRKLKNCVACNR